MGSAVSTDARINETYKSMTFFHKILFRIVHFIDKHGPWHKCPLLVSLFYLDIRRTLHQNYNLKYVGPPIDKAQTSQVNSSNALTGEYGAFLGRNALPLPPKPEQILDPHPSIVASKLLARTTLVDAAPQFNMLAASWIQFMIHDWVDHTEDTKEETIVAQDSVESETPLKEFTFHRTKLELTGSEDIKIGTRNQRTSWWDGSVLYGSHDAVTRNVRTFQDGKLKLGDDGLLQHDENGVGIAGDVKNTWAGISVLQSLFIKEHNAVCDMLKRAHPDFDDEKLFGHARLVTAAILAKIHTIDWTVELLKTRSLDIGMHANWYGLLGRRIKNLIGHTGSQLLSGYLGMKKPNNHGVPYALTEEFTSVYRLHPLLPEEITVRDVQGAAEANKTPPVSQKISMLDLIGVKGERKLGEVGNEHMVASLGHQPCGALTLHNYPTWMRNIPPTEANGVERANHVDMMSLEIYRDRERNVARYNDFRRNWLMIPIKKWEDLSDDKETVELLREIYGDNVEKLDLLVGLLAEKKIKGFAISETAFFVFLLMASRRLEADSFFTTNFNAKTYTKEGLAWVNRTESLKDVLKRHHPELVDKWLNARSAFTVWSSK